MEGGVAVLTGAASGIGRALAQQLAREKMSLALCDIHAERLAESAAAACQIAGATGRLITTHVVDVGDLTQIQAFAEAVVAAHGRVTLLINNAGVAIHGRFDKFSLEDFDWLMRINFWGVVNGTKVFLPMLRRERRAHIVNLSSIFGIIAPAGQTAYAASKFAVRGFTEALRHELTGSNIGVSCIHPGGIRTRIAMDGRVGAGSSESKEHYAAAFEKLAKHSAESAAAKIIAGMKRHKPRILIGYEAYALDVIQRAFPARYWKLLRGGMKTGAI